MIFFFLIQFLNRFETPCIGRKLKSLVRERIPAVTLRAGPVGHEIKGLGPLGRPGEYIRRSTKRKDCRVDLPYPF